MKDHQQQPGWYAAKTLREMTPYERGYYAGEYHVMQGEYHDEDVYYADLSEADRLEYDLGFLDGRTRTPRER